MIKCIQNDGYCIKEENNYCHQNECELMEKTKVTLTQHKNNKEKFDLSIGINEVGTFTESEICHIIQQMDNTIM